MLTSFISTLERGVGSNPTVVINFFFLFLKFVIFIIMSANDWLEMALDR